MLYLGIGTGTGTGREGDPVSFASPLTTHVASVKDWISPSRGGSSRNVVWAQVLARGELPEVQRRTNRVRQPAQLGSAAAQGKLFGAQVSVTTWNA